MSCLTVPDYQNIVALLRGCLLLHKDAITVTQWLQLFVAATDSDGTSLSRWTLGNPVFCINSTHGDIAELDVASRMFVDKVVTQSNHRETGFIEDFLTPHNSAAFPDLTILTNPRLLLAVVDWGPACIALMMARAKHRPEWSLDDRERIRAILPDVRESVLVHKMLDRNHYIAILAHELLNKSPHGVLVLSDDGTIQMANSRALVILSENNGISARDGKLVVHCKSVAKRIATYLEKLGTTNNKELPETDRNLVVKKRSGDSTYQLILGHLKLSKWNLESRHSDKVAVLHLHDPNQIVGPQPEQLIDFYGLTKAQSRLAVQLFQGRSIKEAAQTLYISINTARTHMRGIYARTGVRTQSELLGLLSAGLSSYGKSSKNS